MHSSDRGYLPVIRTFPLEGDDDNFTRILSSANIFTLNAPMIEIVPMPFTIPGGPGLYDWIVFTSKNAISPYFKIAGKMPNQKMAVIGEQTAIKSLEVGITPDFVGKNLTGEDFAREIQNHLQPGERVLLVMGNKAPNRMENILGSKFQVSRVDVYQTLPPSKINQEAISAINNNQYSLVAITSPSAVENLLNLAKIDKNIRFATIGKTTSAKLRSLGIEPVAEARDHCYEALAEVIINEITKN